MTIKDYLPPTWQEAAEILLFFAMMALAIFLIG
jgi:hypothetical protein